ncbi:hypothetical protein ACOMHN_031588 [Nucella lapillus]
MRYSCSLEATNQTGEISGWDLFMKNDGGLVGEAGVLKCYECSDTFKARWDPFTDCQLNVTAVPIATCLETDQYCKVERVTVKGTGATISITRTCAGDCYYGCRIFGYGVSQLRCTSCCNDTLCNTDSGSSTPVLLLGSPFRERSMLTSVVVGLGVLVVRWTSS